MTENRLCNCGQPSLPGKWRICQSCKNAYQRQWYAAHPEQTAVYNAKKRVAAAERKKERRRCFRCRCPVSPDWKSTYCPECSREWRREIAQIPNRRCACGARLPVGRISNYCFDCDREARLLRTERERPCSGGCGRTIRAGLRHNRCSDCERLYRKQLAGRERPCSWCREPMPLGTSHHLCGSCESIRGVEQRNRKRQEKK